MIEDDKFPPGEGPLKSRPPVALVDMIEVATRVGCDMEDMQAALVKAGLRVLPDERQMRDAQVLQAIGRFLDRMEPHLPDVAALMRRQKNRRGRYE